MHYNWQKLLFAKLIFFLIFISACTPVKILWYNIASVEDYKIFPSRKISTESPKPLPLAKGYNQKKIRITLDGQEVDFESWLKEQESTAFLIYEKDSLVYEKYFEIGARDAASASFSMAKSFVSTLIGIALNEGKIKSLDTPVTNYLTGFKYQEAMKKITLRHLLEMSAGFEYGEAYYWFSGASWSYYTNKLKEQAYNIKPVKEPGKTFKYQSINTQFLGMVLEKVYQQTLSELLEEKIWKPMGAEFDATWSVDREKDGIEKAFCCINARARDFAKFAMVFKAGGYYNGSQIVPKQWVKAITENDSSLTGVPQYRLHWWKMTEKVSVSDSLSWNKIQKAWYKKNRPIADSIGKVILPNGNFYMRGHLGQFVFVNPITNTVLVRLGNRKKRFPWPDLLQTLSRTKNG